MKKGQIYEGIVEKVSFPNKGVVPIEDRKVVVKNTIPGQKVSFLVNKVRKGKCEGRLLEVLEKSPAELAQPACLHSGICGGCTYQSLPYEEQLKLKEMQVLELLSTVIPNVTDIFEGIKGSPRQFGYRNKMEYTFGDEQKDGPLSLGMHKRGSFYDIVTVDQCQIVDEDYRKILAATAEFFREKQITFYHRMRHTGYLRHLLVRKAVKTDEILIDLVTTTQSVLKSADELEPMDAVKVQIMREMPRPQEEIAAENKLLQEWKDTILGLSLTGKIAGILHTKNDSVADAVKNEGTEVLYGQDYFYEELLGLRFKITPFSFFQTNSLGAEVLYQTAREFIGETLSEPDKIVYDLYSGTGTIAQMLSPVAKKVIGVEIIEEAVEAAKENAALNQLGNCDFIAGDVLKVLDDISEKPDFIVLDPPRDGIHPKALDKIIHYGVERMIYISCKPTSLQRDLEILQAHGYQTERICCVDMFPATGHVETVCLLSHKSPDSHINVTVEFGEGEGKVPLDKIVERAKQHQPAPKATYKLIQEYVEMKYGFKVHTAYIAEVKRELGLPMYDAHNAAEGLKQTRKHPTQEKVNAIKDALNYYNLI